MSKIICVIDTDKMLAQVYPANGSKSDMQVDAVTKASEFAKANTPDFAGSIDLSNHTKDRHVIVVSFARSL